MTLRLPRRGSALGAVAAVVLVAPLAVAVPGHASTVRNELVHVADDDGNGVYSVVLRDLASRRATTVLPADARGWTYDDPELSPTGDRIALSTDRGSAAGTEGIAVVSRTGSGFRRVTDPPPATATTEHFDLAAAWSPDGNRLLFTRLTATGPTVSAALHTVPVAGGPPTLVASDAYTGDWAPDGRIVYAALTPGAQSGPITVRERNGTSRVIAGAVGVMPTWSPDGSTIAYATVTSADPAGGQDVAQLATVPAAGGPVTLLRATRSAGARTVAGHPAWSPDGTSLTFDLYAHRAGDPFPPGDVWAVDRAGTRAGRVVAGAGDEAQPHVQGPAPSAVRSGTPSTYTPVSPRRILDTRSGTGARAGLVQRAGAVTVGVRGLPTSRGPVPANATAVVVNVTVQGAAAATDVRVLPAGAPLPPVSAVHAPAGSAVPSLVTVALGAGGALVFRNGAAAAHVIGDLVGYYTPDDLGSRVQVLDAGRVLDTRRTVGGPAGAVAGGRFRDLRVTGALRAADGRTLTVPADARAVVLNVTAFATAATDVRVYPTPATGVVGPAVPNLQLRARQTASNLVVVPVGSGGRVRLLNRAGSAHLIADLAGYFAPGASGRFVPVTPTGVLDTRSGLGTAPIPTTAGGLVDLRMAGHRGVPAQATAAVLNVTGTAVSGTSGTDVRAYAAGAAAVPAISHLSLAPGQTRSNQVVVRRGSGGAVRLRNTAGQLHLVADLAGYVVG